MPGTDTAPAGPLVGIVAGEASGDLLAAALIRAVRERHPHVRFAGIAGPKMQAEGCETWVPMEKLAVRGIAEVVAHLPELFRIRGEVRRRLLAQRVPLFVGVDAPDFNLGLERRLKRAGVRTIHFVSPTVWAWRPGRVHSVARAVDRVLALFPFEASIWREAGVTVDYVGHPMAAEAATPASRSEVRERFGLRAATPVFALLPGSRLSEIEMHAETVLRTAARILEARADATFLVPLITRATRERFDAIRHRLDLAGLPLTLMYGHADDALRAADVALVASGTATLEAALARCPHVIFYKVTRVTAWIVRRNLAIPWIGLTNVLAGRFVVPEFLQEDANPVNLAQALVNLFDDTVTRRRLDALFAGFADTLRADTEGLAAQAVAAELRAAGVTV
jgi:lipid-A-disaccharide synthase